MLPKSASDWMNVDRTTPLESSTEIILFVCASVGEYMRILPLAEKLQTINRPFEIAFYSISGVQYMEAIASRMKYGYAPLDRSIDVEKYFSSKNISQILISSNLLWPNFLRHLYDSEIPYSWIGCSFNPQSLFKRWYLSSFKKFFQKAAYIFTTSYESQTYLEKKLNLENSVLVTDPRFEQIIQEQRAPYRNEKIASWKGNSKLLIVGSAYLMEIKLLIEIYEKLKGLGYIILIAPHEREQIMYITEALTKDELEYSFYEDEAITKPITIIKRYGILSRLYRYADYIIVGGGWNKGVHNIIEPLVHSVNLSIGPKSNSYEINRLINMGLAQVFTTSEELLTQIGNSGKVSVIEGKKELRKKFLDIKSFPSTLIFQKLGIVLPDK